MFFQRYGKFTGGIDLPDEKQATLDKPIAPPSEVDRLRVPLFPDLLGETRGKHVA